MSSNLRLASILLLAVGLIISCAGFAQDDDPSKIDWDRARILHERAQRGEKLGPDDQAYYDRARRAFAKRQGGGRPIMPRDSIGLTPLIDLKKGGYKKENGGLYGEGRNEPPSELLRLAMRESALIRPLDEAGKPGATGKIVLLSIGMSNTTQEFSTFKQVAETSGKLNPRLAIVDAAQGGQAAEQWLQERAGGRSTWDVAAQKLAAAGAAAQQVQVVWLKQAEIQPARLGDFPAHARKLADNITAILRMAKEHYPNLRLVYLSSRIYAGYATSQLNPEPYAYESAFSVRWAIQSQMKPAAPRSPVALWGPYLWADGLKARSDGLAWKREDLGPDGTHPSAAGREKVARLLLDFFSRDPAARPWFLAP